MTPVRKPILRDEALAEQSGGVWAVRDYHTTLEQRGIAGAAMTKGYFAMTAAAMVMATAGLLLNSAAAVIGAMCVAPFMGPSRAVCLGVLFRNPRMFVGGFVKQVIGLLVIGVSRSAVLTWLLHAQFPDIGITPEILLRAMPTSSAVMLSALIALSAGAAASLALVVQPQIVDTPWGQVIDAIIGVEIAISLAPPAAVIGIGLALGTPEHSVNAFLLLVLNVLALDLVGSTIILAIGGVRHRHLALEKLIRSTVADTLDVVPGFTAVDSTVHVTLLSERTAGVDVILRREFGGQVPVTLAQEVAIRVAADTPCRVNVSVEVIPLVTYDGIPV